MKQKSERRNGEKQTSREKEGWRKDERSGDKEMRGIDGEGGEEREKRLRREEKRKEGVRKEEEGKRENKRAIENFRSKI